MDSHAPFVGDFGASWAALAPEDRLCSEHDRYENARIVAETHAREQRGAWSKSERAQHELEDVNL